MDRRTFFGALLGSGVVACDEVRGVTHLKLSDLPDYSDERLAVLIPLLAPDTVSLEEDRVLINGEVIREFSATERNVVNMFDGKDHLALLATRLAQLESLEYDEAFRICKEAFLFLATRGGCFPVNTG